MRTNLRTTLACIVLALCLAPAAVAASGPVHWGYDGEVAPEHWGELSPDYAACAAGREQSPVDIPATAALNPPGLGFSYRPSPLNIVNNGHTIQVNYDEGSTLETGDTRYALLQYHLHALSEHTLKGAHTAMELHLVHKDSAGRIAVVGVMLVEGAHNPAYEPILGNMPAEEGEPEAIPAVSVSARDLLPAGRSYYRYNGSLTTPPCTEGVTWFVVAEPVELSAAQIATFTRLYDHNYRPVQPLYGRTFLLSPAPAARGPSGLLIGGAIVLCLAAAALGWGLLRRRAPIDCGSGLSRAD